MLFVVRVCIVQHYTYCNVFVTVVVLTNFNYINFYLFAKVIFEMAGFLVFSSMFIFTQLLFTSIQYFLEYFLTV